MIIRDARIRRKDKTTYISDITEVNVDTSSILGNPVIPINAWVYFGFAGHVLVRTTLYENIENAGSAYASAKLQDALWFEVDEDENA